MKYSEYFAAINNEYSGFPKLNKFMFARMMKIVSLENRIATVRSLRQKAKGSDLEGILWGEEVRLHERLKKETYERSPEQILLDMIEGMIVARDVKK